ncbi:Mpv17/PMP22 family protein [Polychytrium aggregatum]|uniref:Mpv17/PMP22 family protein n=1 Tax=Polychytrium aggregatum TaxID=110093 RepID=UPI0022FEB697|nr:Mpv17/PMP22 family protein [Polychytrium aggregatum]KAI9201985.1 Mpv17/PMP22 family protein [Polychytrium aggregatum]
MGFLKWYDGMLVARPYLTQAISTGILFGSGDVIAQQAVERRGLPSHDAIRTLRLTLYGTAVAGPACAYWYRFLARFIKFENKAAAMTARVAMDQGLFAPSFIGVFFTAMSTMEGKSLAETWQKLKETYPSALVNNYKLWPAVQCINFYLIPVNYQLLFVNTVALGWNSYLSYASAQPRKVHVE